jgi:hypothetical protein
MDKAEIVNKYLDEFPNVANMTLAKKIYNENILVFTSLDNVRGMIRNRKGAHGKYLLGKLKDTKHLSPEKIAEKYNLPKSIETVYEPFKIIGNKGLICSDIHVPFHSIESIESMFNYTKYINLYFKYKLDLGTILA